MQRRKVRHKTRDYLTATNTKEHPDSDWQILSLFVSLSPSLCDDDDHRRLQTSKQQELFGFVRLVEGPSSGWAQDVELFTYEIVLECSNC